MVSWQSDPMAQEDLPKQISDFSDADDETCVFCMIANDQEPDTEILSCDEEVVCFRDIRPSAPHHFLVVPRRHIADCRSLQAGDVPLVERMVQMGKRVLQAYVTDSKDIRLGFHLPPYITVPHLHLHVLAPVSQMYETTEYKYLPNTYWFTTVERFLQRLKPQHQHPGRDLILTSSVTRPVIIGFEPTESSAD